ncbi:MAG: hypothetical protein WCB11_27940 [Terriglobales bacterium]
MISHTISHYIIGKLGGGGMGVVHNLAPALRFQRFANDANDLPIDTPTTTEHNLSQDLGTCLARLPGTSFRTGFLLKSIWSPLESRFDSREEQSRVCHKELEDKEMRTFFRGFFALLDRGQAWIVGTEDGK